MLSSEQVDQIFEVFAVVNWIALAGSIATVVTYLLFKRRFPSSLALYFSIDCFFLSCFLAIGPVAGLSLLSTNYGVCLTQAIGLQFFGTSMIWWFFSIALNLYLIVVWKNFKTDQFERYFHVVCWGLPVIQTILPLIFDEYGNLGLWCWILTDHNGFYEFSMFYGEMGILAVAASILWIRVVMSSFEISRMIRKQSSHTYLIRHILGVILFIIFYSIMLFHRILNAADPDKADDFTLVLLHAISLAGVGVVDFVVFGTTRDNLILWKEFIAAMRRRRSYEKITNASADATHARSTIHAHSSRSPDIA